MAKKAVKKAPRKRGRPAGSKNRDVKSVEVLESCCPKCGSQKRAAYFNRREQELVGTTRDGRLFKKVIWRRTKCLSCDQFRDDKTYEYI